MFLFDLKYVIKFLCWLETFCFLKEKKIYYSENQKTMEKKDDNKETLSVFKQSKLF